MTAFRSPLLNELRTACIMELANASGAGPMHVDLAVRVAIFQAAGHPATQLSRLTGASPAAVRTARCLLTHAARHLELP